tara:strand:- start:968 stop:1120 length:153 start_codon:yes stop_codon:yes gene_type:complete
LIEQSHVIEPDLKLPVIRRVELQLRNIMETPNQLDAKGAEVTLLLTDLRN